MFDMRRDIHHLRTFKSLAYAHVRAGARRHKLNRNAKDGYALGQAEDVLGSKLYFSDERTRKFLPDIQVNEQVLYRDRHTIEYTPTDHDRDVDASIEEGVVDTEDVDNIMEDAKSIVIVLTDAQDADVPDSIWAVPVQKIVVHPTLSTSI